MLSLRLKSGEYLTIGENITIQVFKQTGSAICLEIQAPREIPVLRGAVHERSGERPDGLLESRPKSLSRLRYNAKRQEERLEKKTQRELEYRSAEKEREAALRDLSEIADHLDELVKAHGNDGVRKKLKAACGRIAATASPSKC